MNTSAPRPVGRIYGVGHYVANVVLRSMPEEEVRALLPAGLEPAPQTVAPAGRHPVAFIFGRQSDVHPNFTRIFSMDYLEMAVSVPYTQWVDDRRAYRGPFFFTPRLYLNHWIPILMGHVYGLAKEKARMTMTEDRYEVRALDGDAPIVSARFEAVGPAAPPVDYPLFGRDVPGILNQPIAGHYGFGPYVCSVFDWQLPTSRVRPVDAAVDVSEAFLPGLKRGVFDRSSIESEALGAFRIETDWKFSLPRPCGCLKA